MKNKKGELQFSFAWIFAILVGAFILFLAIFGVYKFMKIQGEIQDAETAKDIGILLNPLESSFETGKKTLISTPLETRIYAGCNINGYFGRQTIRVSQKTYNKWSDTDINVGFQNKYIFSKNYVEGKDFYIYSKPFEFPFKIADLIYLTSSKDSYCFINFPDRIKDEITDWNSKNIFIDEECLENSTRVCFRSGRSCDILVNDFEKSVRKSGNTTYYEGDALMYAAIFADKDIYECQVARLMKRVEHLSSIYYQKSLFLSKQSAECQSPITSKLVVLGNFARDSETSRDLSNTAILREEIQIQNSLGDCRLW